jgi:hypothetical protein
MSRGLSPALTVVLGAVLIVPWVALAQGEDISGGTADPLYVAHVTLTGKAAKPRGELRGTGSVMICVDKARGSISFGFDQLYVTGRPTAGHIHLGAAGAAGPVVFPFATPGLIDPMAGEIQWYGTKTAAKRTISSLISNPGRYYVNVHTQKFPNGAVRGQLGPWKSVRPNDPIAAVCEIG